MGRVAVLVMFVIGLGAASCTENNPPQAQPKPRTTILSPPVAANQPAAAAQRAEKAKPAPARDRAPLAAANKAPAQTGADAPVPPKGAQYTIFCGRVDGVGHVERANRLKTELISKTRMPGWYVIHDDDQSVLYYGFYRSFNDPNDAAETARAQADRRRVESLTDDMQNRLFPTALFVNVESPDPLAPKEWDLAHANGFWTLQIAAYKDSPLRKEAAVDAVRAAREQGIEAYFFHGESVSSVCIGAWPQEAVRINTPKYDTSGTLVVAPTELPSDLFDPVRQKTSAQVVQNKVEIVDPTLRRAMETYPTHAINGMQMVQRVNGKDVPDPSLLVKIPRADEIESTDVVADRIPSVPGEATIHRDPALDDRARPAATPTRAQPKQQPKQQPGLGKLKSVGG